ncbi:transposase [Desulfamplus magnetovallimortis]|uniref:Transposase n=1 Tax=Desulfamplus magnetovallimortis TaxID=1246637 RepID=A0A1W1H8C6_9BACT|nr:Rpn family recombination-promoting nuclease/putative transposase [Desulfamplus magnetovallimortis]SLM28686.1 transposase [Desulfamplus magnetovallimortis]
MGYHDLFFKQTFSIREHAVDFVQHTLPSEVIRGIDYATFALEKGSHVDATLAEHFSDTVYSCQFYGTPLKIALLFEHKSSPDINLPFQLHRYMSNLWENSIKQKEPRMPMIPVVLYHGKAAWNPGTLRSRFKDLPDSVKSFVPDFEYVFVDLSAYSNEFIKKSIFSLASLRIALLIMKNIYDQEELTRHLVQFLELGCSFFKEEQGLKFLESVINYILQVTEIETDMLVKSITCITEKGGELAMTTAERLREEGLQKGIRKGIQKGYNMMVSLVRNAEKKGLSEEIIAQIANLDVASVRKILNNETIDIPLHLLMDGDDQ